MLAEGHRGQHPRAGGAALVAGPAARDRADPGTRRTERIRENTGFTTVALCADEVADLNTFVTRMGVEGDRYNEHHMALVEH